jgi:hypothetical protein
VNGDGSVTSDGGVIERANGQWTEVVDGQQTKVMKMVLRFFIFSFLYENKTSRTTGKKNKKKGITLFVYFFTIRVVTLPNLLYLSLFILSFILPHLIQT